MNKKNIIILTLLSIVLVMCVENHVLPKFGIVKITSDPIGAEILKDGKPTNLVTPWKFSEVLKGSHTFSLKLNSFIDTTFSVEVSEGTDYSENIFLIEANPNGKINLSSNPHNAKIFLNGKNTGKKTPASFTRLQRGDYDFTLKLNLYENHILTIPLAQNQTIERNINLVIAGTAGKLFITSHPEGASIKLDGSVTGLTTPDTLLPISAGQHNVKLSLNNYRDTTITTNVIAGGLVNESVILTVYEARGSITIDSKPQGAKIFIDNSNTGLLTPNTIGKVEAGTYNIKLQLKNYNDTTLQVAVIKDQNKNIGIVKLHKTPIYKINASSNPTGSSTITGADKYKKGEEINLVTFPKPGYRFINWTEEGSNVSTNTTYSFTVTRDRNLVANYDAIGALLVKSDPVGASIFLNGKFTNQVTPHTFNKILAKQYNIKLKLEDFADTSKKFLVNRNKTTNTGIIVLRDTTSDVNISILEYTVRNGRLFFLFTLNQDITLYTVELTRPDGTTLPPTNFGNQIRLEGQVIDVSYSEKITGIWKLRIKGNKIRGRKTAFDIKEKKDIN